MSADREMTLFEFVGTLHATHTARLEYKALQDQLAAATKRAEAWQEFFDAENLLDTLDLNDAGHAAAIERVVAATDRLIEVNGGRLVSELVEQAIQFASRERDERHRNFESQLASLTRRFDELRKALEWYEEQCQSFDKARPQTASQAPNWIVIEAVLVCLMNDGGRRAREALARTANPSPEPKLCADSDLLDWLLTQWETNLSFNSEHWTVTVRGKEVGVGKTLRDALTMAKDARLGHLEEGK